MKRRVGFIGLGDQGAPMATAIAERHELHVWARREASYSALGEFPFSRANNPRDLAAVVEVLCLCLPGDKELEELLFGQGIADALPRGGIVVNHATGLPEAAVRIAEALARKQIEHLDAPVSGGRPGAMRRLLTCFVGGPSDTWSLAARSSRATAATSA